jgi:hypothetical protein
LIGIEYMLSEKVNKEQSGEGNLMNSSSKSKLNATCRDGSRHHSSCLSNASLRRIQQAVLKSGFTIGSRQKPSKGKTPTNRGKGETIKTREELVKSLWETFYDTCKDVKGPIEKESCVVQAASKLEPSLKDIHDTELLPIAPHNGLLTGKPWSTREVQIAMEAIEDRNPEFLFIGPTPIDFDLKDDVGKCVVSELCKMSLKEILKMGKRTFGIVFNTHKHTDPGGHWICLFGCIPSGRCVYFDSYGFFPEAEVMDLMIKLKQQFDTLFPENSMSLIYNDEQHQFGGVECGTYCIVFLSQMADHGNIRKALDTIGTDGDIVKLRDTLLMKNIDLPESNKKYKA